MLIIIISQLFLTSLSAEGETQADSTSPTEPPRPERRSSGTRGECVQENGILTLIVPEKNQNPRVEQSQQGMDQFKANIPKTTLPRPTLVWHMAQGSNLPIKFTLSESGQTIYVEELNVSKAGFVSLTLPETVPPLEVGKSYRWTVSILCSRQHPSQNPFTQAWIERIAPSNSYLKEKELSCDTYEEEGIWYDLLACYFQTRSRADLSQLLSRINLNSLIFPE